MAAGLSAPMSSVLKLSSCVSVMPPAWVASMLPSAAALRLARLSPKAVIWLALSASTCSAVMAATWAAVNAPS